VERRKADGTPSVFAMVLTWNDTEMASQCIQSLRKSDYGQLEIVLVDNGSAEPCGERLAAAFPEIDVVVLPENRGFTGGCNAGLARALERGADYVFLLNNDTVVDPGAVSALVRELEARQDVGAASALILFGDGKRVQFHTGIIDRDVARHTHPRSGEKVRSGDWPTTETQFAPACALMLRTAALRAVGTFDETLGTCWEDYDLCLRFEAAGWRLIVVGDARVTHRHGATTGRVSPYITYYMTRNRLICLFRHGRPSKMLARSLFLARSFWWQIKQYGLRNWECHRAFVKAWIHFALGVRGEGRAPKIRRG